LFDEKPAHGIPISLSVDVINFAAFSAQKNQISVASVCIRHVGLFMYCARALFFNFYMTIELQINDQNAHKYRH